MIIAEWLTRSPVAPPLTEDELESILAAEEDEFWRADAAWDESKHPRDDAGRFSETEGGGVWQKPLDEHTGPYPEGGWSEERAHIYDAHRAKKQHWNTEVERAVSRGDLPIERAMELGWSPYTGERAPKVLPDAVFYHVTTAASAVLRDGLKTRDELNVNRGAGLGGGASNTISFTDDESIAKDIERAIHEMRKVARGEITARDMASQARSAGFEHRVKTVIGGGDEYYEAFLDDRVVETTMGNPPTHSMWKKEEDPSEWSPMGEGWMGGDGKRRYASWTRKATPEEAREHRVQYYKAFAAMREAEGGPMDPLFFTSDTEALANLDPDEIRILKFRPARPGKSAGYQVSALGEWRVFTGRAVTRVD